MKDIYDIYDLQENKNKNNLNDILELNLLHYIFNPSKGVKSMNYYYSPIQYGCMNTSGRGVKNI